MAPHATELLQRQLAHDPTIATNIRNIFNVFTQRSERHQKQLAGGRRPPAALLSLGHSIKRIDMQARCIASHLDITTTNRCITTTRVHAEIMHICTRALSHTSYTCIIRGYIGAMHLRPPAPTPVLTILHMQKSAPTTSTSHNSLTHRWLAHR